MPLRTLAAIDIEYIISSISAFDDDRLLHIADYFITD
jgi:hypothetical protein